MWSIAQAVVEPGVDVGGVCVTGSSWMWWMRSVSRFRRSRVNWTRDWVWVGLGFGSGGWWSLVGKGSWFSPDGDGVGHLGSWGGVHVESVSEKGKSVSGKGDVSGYPYGSGGGCISSMFRCRSSTRLGSMLATVELGIGTLGEDRRGASLSCPVLAEGVVLL